MRNGCIACGLCGGVLRRQGELRGISISPFALLPLTPLKTSRDTLHPDTGETSRTIALRGTSGGWGDEKTIRKKSDIQTSLCVAGGVCFFGDYEAGGCARVYIKKTEGSR